MSELLEPLISGEWDHNAVQYARVYAQWVVGERPWRPLPRQYLLLPGEARAVERALREPSDPASPDMETG